MARGVEGKLRNGGMYFDMIGGVLTRVRGGRRVGAVWAWAKADRRRGGENERDKEALKIGGGERRRAEGCRHVGT